MRKNKIFFSSFLSLFFSSCAGIDLLDQKMDVTSDGSYVIETSMTDDELLNYGQKVIYRFKSVPNMIAVQNLNNFEKENRIIFEKKIYLIPEQNKKKRNSYNKNYNDENRKDNCYSSYCEGNFDDVKKILYENEIILNSVKVAIIDSGVIPSTNKIKNSLKKNINLTSVDNSDLWLSHATYIASFLVGTTTNGIVERDYAPNAEINSIRISFKSDEEESDSKQYGSMQIAAALDEAVSSGAKVVNLSFSYTKEPDENIQMAEKIVMANAIKHGVIFVAASGNDNQNLDNQPNYPSSYDVNNIISVSAHNTNLQKASFSNYGFSVDLSAQGVGVILNNKRGGIDSVSGTSFSAPAVVSALTLYLGFVHGESVESTLNNLFSTTKVSCRFESGENVNPLSRYGCLDTKGFIESALAKGDVDFSRPG